MKKFIALIFISMVANAAIGQAEHFSTKKQQISNEAVETVDKLRNTSPFSLNEERTALLLTFETYSDRFSNDIFKEYLIAIDSVADKMEQEEPILYAYRNGFDKVIEEVKTIQVKEGTAMLWMLYNMGFVVKTPTGCFGIDVDHRLAERLEPYLDFLCVTHNHVDHANVALMDAMTEKGKPVLSNFYKESGTYLSTRPTTYKIGDFTIRTDISDHLRDPKLADFVTIFRIDCGEDSGNFIMLHAGDSGFDPSRFNNVQGPVSMAVLRWGAARENDILGNRDGQVQPSYAILSHLIELRHKPYPHGQASITKTLEHLPNVKCDNTIIPFWGERLTWDNGRMY